ncbi:MAG: hypothetical protein A4S14_13345 [Proteobacteria bacterium SG_bin9]|nr:MAG: hypothetical protein A4S14_13345 [Proteobacteria bacterium SG_bin9]
MAFSLYDASVANFLQTLGAVNHFLDKGLKHFHEKGIDPETIVETKLADDMWPLRNQIVSVAHHSRGALTAAKNGEFVPPKSDPGLNYAGLQALVKSAQDELAALNAADVNALEGRDVSFKVGDRVLPFTAEGFLMTFSLPNFYFHATTAYDILRSKGAPIGKRDFMGRMRMKGA